MWKIDDIEIESRVVLGPMAGVTSQAYRNFMKPFGVGLSVTEMVSDYGLVYGNANTFAYLPDEKTDRPVGIQIFGSSIENAQKAIQIIQKANIPYDFIDLNFGCPVPKVTKVGAGSAWLRKPEQLREYVRAIVACSNKPVTAKIRLGWSSKSVNFIRVAKMLEEAGIKALSIHARTTEQMYAGKADYEALKGLRQTMSIPLIISGDIFSLEDAIEAISITGADAVMVARGALGNPNLIRQIDAFYSTGAVLPDSTLAEQISYMRAFADSLVAEKGERAAMPILRGLAPKFLDGFPGMKKVKMEIVTTVFTRADLDSVLTQINV